MAAIPYFAGHQKSAAGSIIHQQQSLVEPSNDVSQPHLDLQSLARPGLREDVRVAVPWYKPARNKTSRVPDYYLYETEDWLVLPYEMTGLTDAEIAAHKPYLLPILAGLTGAAMGYYLARSMALGAVAADLVTLIAACALGAVAVLRNRAISTEFTQTNIVHLLRVIEFRNTGI